MSATGFLRLKKLKGAGIVTVAARHNLREIQAERGAAGNIDPTRSNLNDVLAGPCTAEGVAALAKLRMQAAGVGKLRKDAVLAIELVLSLPPGHQVDAPKYFTDCLAWAADRFDSDNILSAVVHCDEAAPHIHILLLPLADGRMAGSDLVGNRRTLADMQTGFHAAVAAHHGLRKAPKRLAGTSRQSAATVVLQHLRVTHDAVLRSAAWAVVRDAIERDPASFATALGLELVPDKKPLRMMAQIFTSTGAGPKHAPKVQNPIGFEGQKKHRTLCSVGFAPKTAPATPASPASEFGPLELVRVRDCDLDPTGFDSDTGDYIAPPPRPARAASAAADHWVNEQLSTMRQAVTPHPLRELVSEKEFSESLKGRPLRLELVL